MPIFGVAEPPVELWLEAQGERLGRLPAETDVQPGGHLNFAGQTYAVLERRHRYRFQAGQYRLRQIILRVQPVKAAQEQSWLNGRWILGNGDCRFNAQSPLVRCAVNPEGPCQGGPAYESVPAEISDSPIANRAPLAKSQPD